jgi:2-polyprenyl-3-methyl-5-hydroxy-6-metoxy-1,4-benzoquinol methylase
MSTKTVFQGGTNEKPYDAEICNICGSTSYRRVRYFAHWDICREPVTDVAIVQCRGCGVRRRQPGIIDDYEKDYHAPYVAQGQSIHPHQLSHFADLMTARLRKFNEAGAQFLDIGSSTGRALQLAKMLGFVPTGLDYSKWAYDLCVSLGFEMRHGSLLGQWPEGQRFDIVHCSHTIEHVPDPVVYVQEMYHLLKPGGHLMLACPNYASLPRLILGDKWGTWCLDSHLWQFTKAQVERMLRQTGFRILTARTLHGYVPDSLLKKRLLDLGASLGFGDGLNVVALRP